MPDPIRGRWSCQILWGCLNPARTPTCWVSAPHWCIQLGAHSRVVTKNGGLESLLTFDNLFNAVKNTSGNRCWVSHCERQQKLNGSVEPILYDQVSNKEKFETLTYIITTSCLRGTSNQLMQGTQPRVTSPDRRQTLTNLVRVCTRVPLRKTTIFGS